jgi:nucleotide-binding universal stress UspA family protein
VDRILVAFDGSPPSRRALEHAARLVGAGELILLHVLPEIVPEEYTPSEVDPEETAAEIAELQEACAALAARGISARALPIGSDAFADAAEAIVAEAERCGAELIAVGTRGHGALSRLALGSVSTRVAHDAHCDVLIVR